MRLSPIRLRTLGAGLALLVIGLVGVVPPAGASAASRSLSLGFADSLLRNPDPETRRSWQDRAVAANARIVRMNVYWRDVTSRKKPVHPANPADPAYDFELLDQSITDAVARGMKPLLTVYDAPDWAEGKDRPAHAPVGTWKPDPAAVGSFGTALAKRYSGRFRDLPRVRDYQLWNEPNLGLYLTPQRAGGKVRSPAVYRPMLNAFYRGVHSVNSSNVVVSGGTSPYGNPSGLERVPPITFLRKLFCLKNTRKLKRDRCPVRTKVDVVAHHPINSTGGPARSALSPEDASTPDMGRVVRVVRAAEKQRTILPRRHRPIWVTEFWWKSNPPDRSHGVSLNRQARWLADSLYRFWKAHVSVTIYMLMRDTVETTSGKPPTEAGTGLYLFDDVAKPALRSFRFPFVVKRGRGRAVAWGMSPSSGKVKIEARGPRGWQVIKKLRARPGRPFTVRLNRRAASGPGSFRASADGTRSNPWRLK